MLEPLYDVLAHSDVPITKLLPTHVNRAEPLFEAALAYARKGGISTLPAVLMSPWIRQRPSRPRCAATFHCRGLP